MKQQANTTGVQIIYSKKKYDVCDVVGIFILIVLIVFIFIVKFTLKIENT